MGAEDMKLSEEQIQKLRDIELDIFKAFIRVCEELKLRYFVVQGTLLGAVRHQGFIPWDDDIDVGMLREDYEQFLKKGQALLPQRYFIQTHDTDPAYPHGFAKIRDSKTAFVETTCKNLKMNHGIYIDVFPFDLYPDDWMRKGWFDLRKLLLRYRIRSALYIPQDQKLTIPNVVRRALKIGGKICYPSLQKALERQTKLYGCVRQGKNRINNGSPWGKRECIPAEWLEKNTVLQFEGMEVQAPACYQKYLEHVYGDYMELPPPEKRIPHHFICKLDFENAYAG